MTIQTISSGIIEAYPNPTSDVLHISILNNEKMQRIDVINSTESCGHPFS
ncbi:MAG: hypothetical protein H0S84_00205 [Bacteroidales bacterium]|jgi:hypothetical protein|nr:hypothetical protein [Bacteroidales bacterium]